MNYRDLLGKFFYVMRSHRQLVEQNVEKTGVHHSQHRTLMFLAENPGISQKELAGRFHVSPATIAVMLKKLEGEGYIRRNMDSKDNRVNQVEITAKGKRIVKDSRRIFDQLDRELFDGFSQEDLMELESLLERMAGNIEKLKRGKEEI